MKQFLITIAGVFVGLLLFFVAIPILLIASVIGAASKGPDIPAQSVLMLDLRESLTDQAGSSPFAAFGGSGLSVMKVVTTLHEAEDDERIKALFIRLPEGGMPPAAAEEIRGAVKSFRAAGKRVVAHSQGFQPTGVVTSTYMLGAAADEFWMQDTASFQVTGIANEEVFLKGLFDRYGVVADFQQRHEFKNAANPFLYETFTPEHRAATLSWMSSVYDNALLNAAADRRQSPQALRAALESGPMSAPEAQVRRLVDRLGQVEFAEETLLDRFGDDAETLEFDDYAATAGDGGGDSGPEIAVVEAEGAIVTGTGDTDPFGSNANAYSDDVAEALYKAAKDDDVRAVVFRVSSPGGSDTASDQILAAVQAVQKAKKPVVVSMGTYAASGGYWISSKADAIVAQPSTLTGSIGVFGGKFAIGPALERYGVNVENVSVGGEFADAFTSERAFNPSERAEFSEFLDRIYQGFITRVAEGRDLSVARVNEIARGRVWTGAQARQLQLVDETGGFYQALATAKRLAKIDADTEVDLRRFPAQKSPFEALEGLFGASAASVRTLAAAAWVFGDPRAQALLDKMAETRLRADGATVLESARVD
ncbi:MAG: signal peptide peptidase SppA [Proteobacteria bacterium]|nr:signal peptide peptidase SppA [Pseudomonadota bacterium]